MESVQFKLGQTDSEVVLNQPTFNKTYTEPLLDIIENIKVISQTEKELVEHKRMEKFTSNSGKITEITNEITIPQLDQHAIQKMMEKTNEPQSTDGITQGNYQLNIDNNSVLQNNQSSPRDKQVPIVDDFDEEIDTNKLDQLELITQTRELVVKPRIAPKNLGVIPKSPSRRHNPQQYNSDNSNKLYGLKRDLSSDENEKNTEMVKNITIRDIRQIMDKVNRLQSNDGIKLGSYESKISQSNIDNNSVFDTNQSNEPSLGQRVVTMNTAAVDDTGFAEGNTYALLLPNEEESANQTNNTRTHLQTQDSGTDSVLITNKNQPSPRDKQDHVDHFNVNLLLDKEQTRAPATNTVDTNISSKPGSNQRIIPRTHRHSLRYNPQEYLDNKLTPKSYETNRNSTNQRLSYNRESRNKSYNHTRNLDLESDNN